MVVAASAADNGSATSAAIRCSSVFMVRYASGVAVTDAAMQVSLVLCYP
jgi:hypothetical protein